MLSVVWGGAGADLPESCCCSGGWVSGGALLLRGRWWWGVLPPSCFGVSTSGIGALAGVSAPAGGHGVLGKGKGVTTERLVEGDGDPCLLQSGLNFAEGAQAWTDGA